MKIIEESRLEYTNNISMIYGVPKYLNPQIRIPKLGFIEMVISYSSR